VEGIGIGAPVVRVKWLVLPGCLQKANARRLGGRFAGGFSDLLIQV
jgi:hypothetical protein